MPVDVVMVASNPLQTALMSRFSFTVMNCPGAAINGVLLLTDDLQIYPVRFPMQSIPACVPSFSIASLMLFPANSDRFIDWREIPSARFILVVNRGD